jgi:hypothetical protein
MRSEETIAVVSVLLTRPLLVLLLHEFCDSERVTTPDVSEKSAMRGVDPRIVAYS